MQKTHETQVRFLGPKDPLKEEMATLSSSLAWRIPRMEAIGRLLSIGLQRVQHDRSDLAHTHAQVYTGE